MNAVIDSVTSRFLSRSTGKRHDMDIPRSMTVPSRSTLVFVLGCMAWYTSSSLSSNIAKALLSKQKVTDRELPYTSIPPAFPYPVTLTLIHFAFVNAFCALCASRRIFGRRALTRLVRPSFSRVAQVGQLAFFNVLGQALSSLAISRVPVSTVHTIKALSPLFTVVSYTFLFNVSYSSQTYMSLLPLTAGVMMACTGFAFSPDDLVGLTAALGSTFVFVAQNIYSKKLLRKPSSDAGVSNAHGESYQLDKLNIIFYSSACSIVLMVPMALYYDGASLWFAAIGDGNRPWNASPEYPSERGFLVLSLLLVNGFVHFSQNILAFNVLSMVSPVTYSIASLLKRVFVIVLAIIWFHQRVTFLQWVGIAMTFYGLWMYNDSKTKQDVADNEARALRKQDSEPSHILPLTTHLPATTSASISTEPSARVRQHTTPYYHQPPQHHRPYVPPQNPGGWNDIPLAASSSYIKDATKSLPSPPDSVKDAA